MSRRRGRLGFDVGHQIMGTLRHATEEDLNQLVHVARLAFQDDEKYKPQNAIVGGPPGHDKIDQHRKWLSECEYFVWEENGTIVGSCIVAVNGDRAFLKGIHVLPDQMGQGIGSSIISAIEYALDEIVSWTLETPDYATRNHQFYEKNGYRIIDKTPINCDLGFGFHVYHKGSQ